MGLELIMLVVVLIIAIFVFVGYKGRKKKAEKGDIDDQRTSKPANERGRSKNSEG